MEIIKKIFREIGKFWRINFFTKIIVILLVLFCFNKVIQIKNKFIGNENYKTLDNSFTFPTTGLAAMLPVPDVTKGKIIEDSSNEIEIYLGDFNEEKFNKYVEECKNKGFNIDYSKTEDRFEAKNTGNYSVYIKFEEKYDYKEKILSIELRKNKEVKAEDKQNNQTTSSDSNQQSNENQQDNATSQNSSQQANKQSQVKTNQNKSKKSQDTIDPNFKAVMDAYEQFFNRYVDFMIKYRKSNNSVEMLGDYTKMMTEYADQMSKLNTSKTGELTSAELKYYMDVYGRIMQKISTIPD